MEKKASQPAFSVGILILSLVGFLLILFTDWGGYLHYDEYYGQIEYYIHPFTLAGFLPLFLIAGIFGYTSYIAFLSFQKPEKLNNRLNRLALIGSLSIVGINILGVILFAILAANTDWWLDTSFYASLIGGIINSILFFLSQSGKIKF